MRRYERLELGNRLAKGSQRKLRVDPVLEGSDPQLFEPADRTLGEGLVPQVREWRAAPEPERVVESAFRLLGPPAGKSLAATGRERPKPLEVELARPETHHVARVRGNQHARPGARRTARLDGLAQLRDAAVQGRRSRRRRRLAPDEIDQLLARDDLVGVQQQYREHRTLPRTAQRQRLLVRPSLDRAEQSELEISPQAATVTRNMTPRPRPS